MPDRVHYHPNLIFSVGTQVVTLVDIAGSAGLDLHAPGTDKGRLTEADVLSIDATTTAYATGSSIPTR